MVQATQVPRACKSLFRITSEDFHPSDAIGLPTAMPLDKIHPPLSLLPILICIFSNFN
jgi:hypothetical protein